MNNYGKIVVIMGGDSPEREISLISGNAVFDSLSRSGFNVHKFDYSRDDIKDFIASDFDLAVIMLHGKGGEDGTIQGFLEVLKIPYTSSGVLASGIAMDKHKTKLIWQSCGIPLLPSQYLTKEEYEKNSFKLELNLPVIVKPNSGGSTLGMTVVHKEHDLNEALDLVFRQDNSALIEEFIVGREFTVVVCNNRVYPIIKIEPPVKKTTYDYQDKYFTSSTKYTCPFDLGDLQTKVEDYVRAAYDIIGANGVARVDFMISDSRGLFFLEINTIPGMTNHSFVPMAFKAIGINFDELCKYIISSATLDMKLLGNR